MIRQRKKRLSKSAKGVVTLVVGSTGASLIGSAMPGTSGIPLQTVGSTMSKFVGPATTAMGAGIVMNQLRNFPKPKYSKKKKGGKRLWQK